MESTAAPQVGSELTLKITDIAFGGEGVARHNGQVFFIKFVAPDETVRARITEMKSQYGRAELLEVIDPSPERVSPRCPYFGACGGCQYQHLAYAAQLKVKYKQVTDIFQRIGGFDPQVIDPIIPCSTPYGYRNRVMVRSQWDKTSKRMKVGYLRHNSRLVVDVDHCHIAAPKLNDELQTARANPPPRGGLKVTLREFPDEWEVPKDSFFQNNFHLLPQLVSVVKARLRAAGTRYLVDAYCGVGFFSIELADQVDAYIGVEVDRPAIQAARKNALRHDRQNGELLQGPAENLLPSLLERYPPDETTIILDPPRTGCHTAIVDAIRYVQPAQVIYVSCHPATLARDLRALCEGDRFRLDKVVPLDMFPQTQHMECVSDLRLTKSSATKSNTV